MSGGGVTCPGSDVIADVREASVVTGEVRRLAAHRGSRRGAAPLAGHSARQTIGVTAGGGPGRVRRS